MDYDPSPLESFAHFLEGVANFLSMASGLLAGGALAILGAQWGFQSGHPQIVSHFLGQTWTEAGVYALLGYGIAFLPFFFIGKAFGFFCAYPFRVALQLLLLTEKIEKNTRLMSYNFQHVRMQDPEPPALGGRPRLASLPKIPEGVLREQEEQGDQGGSEAA